MTYLRLCLYDALDYSRLARKVGRIYRDTPANRKLIRETIAEYNELAASDIKSHLVLAVFPASRRVRKGGVR